MKLQRYKATKRQTIIFFVIVIAIVVGVGIALGAIFLREGTLTLQKTSYTLKVGGSTTLKPTFNTDYGRPVRITYTTSNKTVAEVSDSGTVTAKRAGKCEIYGETKGGQKFTAQVEVKEPKFTKTIYLTFEDGPDQTVTGEILSLLKKYNAKATFFITGEDADLQRDLVKQEYDAGHTLGVYCYQKDYNSIYKSASAYIRDFNKTESLLEEITGATFSYWRFPGGGDNDFVDKETEEKILTKLHNNGYTEMDYNCMVNDAIGGQYTTSEMLAYGIETIDGCIATEVVPVVQFHDSASNTDTPAVVEGILKEYKNRGYTFKGLEDYQGAELTFSKQ